jgi:hypothetical protein
VLQLIQSKKMVLSLVGVVAVVVLVMVGRDLETVKWVGGFIAGIVASLNLGQGLADGLSGGQTSATRPSSTQDPSQDPPAA